MENRIYPVPDRDMDEREDEPGDKPEETDWYEYAADAERWIKQARRCEKAQTKVLNLSADKLALEIAIEKLVRKG